MKSIFSFLAILLLSPLTWGQCALTYSVDSIPASCAGSCDGAINFSFSNSGTPAAPYVAIFQNSSGVTIGSETFFGESGSVTFPGVCAEVHTVSIQSVFNSSCFYQTTVTVTEPPAVVISSIDVVHETSGMSNGEITINATGGITPYLYSIDNGVTFQLSNQFTGLDAGTYFVIVQDANGCAVSQVVSVGLIESTGCEVIASASPQPTSCSGVCDGQIIYTYENIETAVPGAPYSVTLEDSDGNVVSMQTYLNEADTILFNDLCADTYTISVQGTSCSFIITGTVLSPAPLTLYINSTNPSFGESDGTAELIVVGGVPPFQFGIDGGITFQLSPDFSGLAEGTYPAVVQDANGCFQQVNFTLTDNTPCSLVVTAAPGSIPSCYESCDGSITYMYDDVNAHTPYSFELIQGGVTVQTATHGSPDGSGSFANLCAGDYNVQVTDGSGCTAMFTTTLTQPSELMITGVTITNATPGVSDGTATISATGGQPAYSYSLDGTTYQAGNNFSGLSSGMHIAYVMDANSCTNIFTFIIQKDPGCDFNITTDTDTTSCTGTCDGSVEYQFTGAGSDPPFYIVLENDGNVIETDVNYSTNVAGTFSGLCPGTYLLTVSNSSGCEQVANVIIHQPSPITVSASTQPASTGNNDGQIFVIASGGTVPYEFSIDGQVSWQGSSIFSGLGSGIYTTWVKDANGCIGIYTAELTDTSNCSSIIEIQTTGTTCVEDCDGTLTCTFLDPYVNPPYVIQLFQGTTLIDTSGSFPDFSGLYQFSGLCAGPYSVSVVDTNGCTDVQKVYIHGPDYLQVTATNVVDATAGGSDGSAEIIVTGGTAPYEFTINDGLNWQVENVFNDLDAGSYIMMIKDANDCIFIHSFIVNEQPGCDITTTFFLTEPISCHDSCDAIIQYSYFEAVNTPPYIVKLIYNSGVISTTVYSTNNFTGIWDSLCLGVYSISVTNGNGCMAFMPTLTISVPPDLSLSGIVTDASVGIENGSIELSSTGGTGQHLYSLDIINYQGLTSFENLAPGIYTAHVIDENDCKDKLDFEIFENPGCNIALTASSNGMLSCTGDCNGSISFDYDDVNANPPYSIVLTNSVGVVVASAIGTNPDGTGSFTNLCAGVYNVTVTDAWGCQSASSAVTIEQPPYLQVDIDVVQPTLGYYNGSITLNPTGGTPPFEYSTNNQVTWSNTNSWSILAAGFYVIYVKDANGCVQVICVVLSDLDISSITEISTEISVYPNPTQGMIFVNASDIRTLYVYDLSGKRLELPEMAASNGIALDFSTAAAGMYVLEITTLNGDVLRTQVIKN